MDKKKVIIEYLKGNIKDKKSLDEFLKHEELKEKMAEMKLEMAHKVESIKPTDVSEIDLKLNDLRTKVDEELEVELIIE